MKLEQEVGAEAAEVSSCLSLSVLLWLSDAGEFPVYQGFALQKLPVLTVGVCLVGL